MKKLSQLLIIIIIAMQPLLAEIEDKIERRSRSAKARYAAYAKGVALAARVKRDAQHVVAAPEQSSLVVLPQVFTEDQTVATSRVQQKPSVQSQLSAGGLFARILGRKNAKIFPLS